MQGHGRGAEGHERAHERKGARQPAGGLDPQRIRSETTGLREVTGVVNIKRERYVGREQPREEEGGGGAAVMAHRREDGKDDVGRRGL